MRAHRMLTRYARLLAAPGVAEAALPRAPADRRPGLRLPGRDASRSARTRWSTSAAGRGSATACKIRAHEGEVHIGAKTVLGQECTISAFQHVSIGRECIVADRVMLIDFDHGVVEVERPIREQGIYKRDVRIGHNVWIGYGACLPARRHRRRQRRRRDLHGGQQGRPGQRRRRRRAGAGDPHARRRRGSCAGSSSPDRLAPLTRSQEAVRVNVSSRFDVAGFGVIVTGGASGLGLAYGEVLAAHGARVTLIDLDADAVAAQASRLQGEGLDVRGAVADVTDHAALDQRDRRGGGGLRPARRRVRERRHRPGRRVRRRLGRRRAAARRGRRARALHRRALEPRHRHQPQRRLRDRARRGPPHAPAAGSAGSS